MTAKQPTRCPPPPAHWPSQPAQAKRAGNQPVAPPPVHWPGAGGAGLQKREEGRVRSHAPPAVHWPGAGRAAAPQSVQRQAAAPLLPAPVRAGRGVIQRHIIWDQLSNSFISNGKRPGTHLSDPTLVAVVQDLMNTGARNQAEADFETEIKNIANTYNLGNVWGNAVTVVNIVKSYNVLSTYGFAICHKVPYSAFEKLLVACIQLLIAGNLNKAMRDALTDVMDRAIGNHNSWNKLVKALQKSDILSVEWYARELGDAFDACSDNLFIGYKSTNSSVGDHSDLHWDSLGTGVSSPRGNDLLGLMQKAEGLVFGSWQTVSDTMTDTSGTWVLYSGVFGTKKQGTGYVLT